MPQTQSVRSERFEARIAPESLVTLRKAAEMQGRSLSDFVIHAAELAARQTIEDLQVVRLSAEDQTLFCKSLLDDTAEPVPAMHRAAEHHAKLFGAA